MADTDDVRTLQDRLMRMRVGLAQRIPFIGFLVLRASFRVVTDDRITSTAGVCIDGTTYMNVHFCSRLSDSQLRGLMAHEVLHVALLWWQRQGTRNSRLWNQAHDYVVNHIVTDMSKMEMGLARGGKWIELPPGGLYRADWAGLTGEEIYALLLQNSELVQADSPLEGDCLSAGASTAQGRAAENGSSAAERQVSRKWRLVVEQAAMHHRQVTAKNIGSVSGALEKILDEIKDPRVDWRDVLSQFVGERAGMAERTLLIPSRRSEAAGVHLAGSRKSGRPDVTVLWDTSGSMGPEETAAVMAEVCGLMQEYGLELRLLIVDASLHADVRVHDPADIVPLLTGGGGSDFCPAFKLLQEEQDQSLVVAFTDGYISVPESLPPCLGGILWIVTEGGVRPAHWGRAIQMVNKMNEAREI